MTLTARGVVFELLLPFMTVWGVCECLNDSGCAMASNEAKHTIHRRFRGRHAQRPGPLNPSVVGIDGIVMAMLFMLLSASLLGCAAKRPVLYPNYHLTTVGQEQAASDIDDCMALARDWGAGAGKGGQVAKDTAAGAAVGGATGAAVGAVVGNVGKGAGAGAAGGAAGALTRGVIRSGEPDPIYRRFVDKCLRDKGYEPIGWQ